MPLAVGPERSSLRSCLDCCLFSGGEFEAFCADCFPEVAAKFCHNQNRLERTTLLFEATDTRAIFEKLRSYVQTLDAERKARFLKCAGVLQWPATTELIAHRFRRVREIAANYRERVLEVERLSTSERLALKLPA